MMINQSEVIVQLWESLHNDLMMIRMKRSLSVNLGRSLFILAAGVAVCSIVYAEPDVQSVDTVLLAGSRVAPGNEMKNEFYILAQGEAYPIKLMQPMELEKQLRRVDTPQLLWAFNQSPQVDVILSQIAQYKQLN